ncbi:MAG: protein kinase domain-containing protein [Beijerinckiaceae bacterium]
MSFLRQGSLLLQYRIVKILGSGGFGVTYLARDEKLEKLFAIKEYFPSDFAFRKGGTVRPKTDYADDFLWGKERFLDEAQIMARFIHPNIVRVIQFLEAHNTAYIVEEYEGPRSLAAWLSEIESPPKQTELDLLVEPLLDALDVLHRNDVVHRDVAPDNIHIRDDGSPVLLDFGSARDLVAQGTRPMSAVVKPWYSPPEQYSMRAERQGAWSDIYSLAATLYHAVTGTRPEDATERMLADEYVPVGEAAKESYRESFLAAIDWGLKLVPADRPQTIGEWRIALLGQDDAPRASEKTGPEQILVSGEDRKTLGESANSSAGRDTLPTSFESSNGVGTRTRPVLGFEWGFFLFLMLAVAGIIVPLVMGTFRNDDRAKDRKIPVERVAESSQPPAPADARSSSIDEDQTYRSAQGSLKRLRAYVYSCTSCTHKAEAVSQIAAIEHDIHALGDRYLCQRALNSAHTNWDADDTYAGHVEEAQSRRLTVDDCRTALSEVQSKPGTQIAPAQVINYRVYENQDLDGGDIEKSSSVDVGNCTESCRQNARCRAFTFDKWNHLCILKADFGVMRLNPRATTGIRSDMSAPPTATSKILMERYRGKAFPGSGYRTVEIAQFEKCENLCLNENFCVAYTFMKNDRMCHLFYTTGEYFRNTAADSGGKRQEP